MELATEVDSNKKISNRGVKIQLIRNCHKLSQPLSDTIFDVKEM